VTPRPACPAAPAARRAAPLAAAAARLVGALWAPRTWRATLHALTGLLIVVITAVLALLWAAAVIALVEGNKGAPILTAVWAVGAVLGAIPLAWWLTVLGAVQRARFRAVLGVDIPAPAPPDQERPPALEAPPHQERPPAGPGRLAGRWRPRRRRAGRRGPTWRQAGYHLAALVIGPAGGALVGACWTALLVAAVYPAAIPGGRALALGIGAVALLAAPWVALGVAAADTAAARALLGPGAAAELTRQVEELSVSRAGLAAAADAERRRIERDLHDGAQQRLIALAASLGMARSAAGDNVPGPVRELIGQWHEEALAAMAELRELVRGLHPAVLTDRGLDAALSGLVARVPHPVRLHVEVVPRCPPGIEAIAYFTVSEALANVARHARASRADITVRRCGDRLRVTVTDDGCGGARLDAAGSGLRGLAQRARAAGGWLRVDSPAGGPTAIAVELPCAS
jgi:signal transduction histidine kinase